MKEKLSIILLLLLCNLSLIQLAHSFVYCGNCSNWVDPLPGRICPKCNAALPGPPSGEEPSAACAIDSDLLLAIRLQKQEWESGQTASDHFIALQLQSTTQVVPEEGFVVSDDSDDVQIISVMDSHQQAEQNAYEQILTMLPQESISYRNSENLKSAASLAQGISTEFTYHSDGTQDDLDRIIQKRGFLQVPVNEACFTTETADALVQYIFTEVQDQSHHEYLLIFFQPISETNAYYHFIPITIFDNGLSIIIPTLNQESYFTVSIEKNSINMILLTLFSQLNATEFYVYHRSSIYSTQIHSQPPKKKRVSE